jgi:N6-adenosine-specific RNA methylase IME4
MNLRRRHLDESQRALVAARAKEMFEEEARARQEASRARRGERADARAQICAGAPRKAAGEAAKLVNVSPRSVENASRVLKHGAPELVAAVESGKVSVSAAAAVAPLPVEEQRELVAKGPKEVAAAAKAVRAKKAARKKAAPKAAPKSAAHRELVARLRAEPPPDTNGPFRVVVLDPPWPLDATSGRPGWAGPDEEPPMTVEEIRDLDVSEYAHHDAIVWLWAPSTMLGEAFQCLAAWGFTPRTVLCWDKVHPDTGEWLHTRTEHCVVATRGKAVVDLSDQTNLLSAPTKGSRKPELCPGTKVDAFAWSRRDGWRTWLPKAPQPTGGQNAEGTLASGEAGTK